MSAGQDLNPGLPEFGGPALCHLPYVYSLISSVPISILSGIIHPRRSSLKAPASLPYHLQGPHRLIHQCATLMPPSLLPVSVSKAQPILPTAVIPHPALDTVSLSRHVMVQTEEIQDPGEVKGLSRYPNWLPLREMESQHLLEKQEGQPLEWG